MNWLTKDSKDLIAAIALILGLVTLFIGIMLVLIIGAVYFSSALHS